MNLWPTLLAAGLLTFAIRLSFIVLEGRYQPAPWFVALLPFVPVAALTALVTPDLLLVAGELRFGIDNPRLWAGLMAIAVAAWRKNILLTIGSGFMVLWLIQLLR